MQGVVYLWNFKRRDDKRLLNNKFFEFAMQSRHCKINQFFQESLFLHTGDQRKVKQYNYINLAFAVAWQQCQNEFENSNYRKLMLQISQHYNNCLTEIRPAAGLCVYITSSFWHLFKPMPKAMQFSAITVSHQCCLQYST